MTGSERMTDAQRAAKMRALNDRFRHSLRGGRLLITRGLLETAGVSITDLLNAIRHFDAFNEDNDPYREHDYGSLLWRGSLSSGRLTITTQPCATGLLIRSIPASRRVS